MKSENYERNILVLSALSDAKSNFDKLHKIEHHIYCYTEEDFLNLQKAGHELGYLVCHESELADDEGSYWQLDLVKSVKPNIFSIEAQSLEIESLAETFNADYDGWGTEVNY